MNKNLYEVLGVAKDSTADEIKRAYRSLAQMWHPDKGNDDGTIFKRVQEAYDILGDVLRREEYDRTGQVGKNQPPLRDRVMQEFAAMLNALMNDPRIDFNHTSILSHMRQMTEQQVKQFEARESTSTAKIERITNVRNRMSSKTDDNPMTAILDNLIQQENGLLVQFEGALVLFREMLLVLEDFEYRTDEMHPWTSYMMTQS